MWRSEVNMRCCSSWAIHLDFEISSFIGLELAQEARLTDSEPQGSTHSCLSALRLYTPSQLVLKCAFWGLNLGPRGWVVSTLPTDLPTNPSAPLKCCLVVYYRLKAKDLTSASPASCSIYVAHSVLYPGSEEQGEGAGGGGEGWEKNEWENEKNEWDNENGRKEARWKSFEFKQVWFCVLPTPVIVVMYNLKQFCTFFDTGWIT